MCEYDNNKPVHFLFSLRIKVHVQRRSSGKVNPVSPEKYHFEGTHSSTPSSCITEQMCTPPSRCERAKCFGLLNKNTGELGFNFKICLQKLKPHSLQSAHGLFEMIWKYLLTWLQLFVINFTCACLLWLQVELWPTKTVHSGAQPHSSGVQRKRAVSLSVVLVNWR